MGKLNWNQRPTFSLQSVLLITAMTAILLGLFFQGRKLSEMARAIANFHTYVGFEWPNAPQEPDTFDYGSELLANTADLKIYLFTVRSGDPHELLFKINGNETVVDSYYDLEERTNKSTATVCIDWITESKIKITLADPAATDRFDFATRKSKHIFHKVTDDFNYDKVAYPELNAMGGGGNGVYDWFDELELFHWNGDESASIHVRFKNRSVEGGSDDGDTAIAGTTD